MSIKIHDDMAIVIKALEIRSDRQALALQSMNSKTDSVLLDAKQEVIAWSELCKLIGDPETPQLSRPTSVSGPRCQPETVVAIQDWAGALEESRIILQSEGIDPEKVKLVVPGVLTGSDVAWALAIGALGAALPSIGPKGGSLKNFLDDLEGMADQGKLPGFMEAIFGGSHPGAFMDGGAGGVYHRFVHGHDIFWAMGQGVSILGFTKGVGEVFQHLLRDSCGMTGVPLPGSQYFGETIAKIMGADGIKEMFSGRDLSRYAGFQMADGVATASVSFMLWVNERAKGIDPDSIRAKKIAILAHGMCFSAIAIAAVTPGLQNLVPYRSHLNHGSLIMLAKNVFQLWQLTKKLDNENQERFAELEKGMEELRAMRFGGAQALDREFNSICNAMAY